MGTNRSPNNGEAEAKLETLARWITEANSMVWFTGAGISTDSGLPDYRGPNGVWTRQDQGLPPPAPDRPLSEIRPNPAHQAIVQFEKLGKCDFLISQNVDNLHLESGFPFDKIAELHGNKDRLRCTDCEKTHSVVDLVAMPRRKKNRINPTESYECPNCGGVLRRSVVNFGDALPKSDLTKSYRWAETADVFIVVGSSCQVHPAADLPRVAVKHGSRLAVLNIGPTEVDSISNVRFDEERVAHLLPRLLNAVRAETS